MSIILSPAQFKALVRLKGWTYEGLSKRWGVSRVWVSRIAANPNRPPHYVDAVFGLPENGEQGSSARAIKKYLKRIGMVEQAPTPKPKGPGFRYQGYFVLGRIVTAAVEVGSLAQEGERGVIIKVVPSMFEERYVVRFNGGEEEFSPELADQYLADTGLSVDDGASTSL